MNYQQATAFVESFSRSGAPVTDLSRISGLLKRLGNPQKYLHFIHIAGTNGKGSCAEYLTQILTESGYRTGTLTSPYIRHYRDRIRLNGQDIPEETLCEICERMSSVIDDAAYSQFEITLAIALLYFCLEQVELVVWETGIGGLLDATNVIKSPLVCVITSISMDHTQILGNTIEEIARQKAGIIKPDSCVAVSPDNNNSVRWILGEVTMMQDASMMVPSMDDCVIEMCSISGNQFLYKSRRYMTRMGGKHQISNALTVLQTIEFLREKGYAIPEKAVKAGLQKAQVAGRIQVLQQNPLVILDGGHNLGGVGALTDLLTESGIDRWVGICGMTDTKDANAAAFQLALLLDEALCVDGFAENAIPKAQLCEEFKRQHIKAVPIELTQALPTALQLAEKMQGAVVICGSLYLACWYLNQGA